MPCFHLDGSCSVVHVAFNREEPEQSGDEREVTFLSFCCHTLQMYAHNTGMQFCCFECTEKLSLVKKSSLNIVDYALMLPYSRRAFPFQRQFTLVHSYWEAILCNNNAHDSRKGHVHVHSG